jgi:hypothetical protein
VIIDIDRLRMRIKSVYSEAQIKTMMDHKEGVWRQVLLETVRYVWGHQAVDASVYRHVNGQQRVFVKLADGTEIFFPLHP